MVSDFYSESKPYEDFVRLAHGSETRTMRNGADQSFMQNLMRTEIGKEMKGVGSYEKQLLALKKYIAKAINKYLLWELTQEDKAIFEQLKKDLLLANNAADLMCVIDAGLEVIIRFRSL